MLLALRGENVPEYARLRPHSRAGTLERQSVRVPCPGLYKPHPCHRSRAFPERHSARWFDQYGDGIRANRMLARQHFAPPELLTGLHFTAYWQNCQGCGRPTTAAETSWVENPPKGLISYRARKVALTIAEILSAGLELRFGFRGLAWTRPQALP